MLTPGLGASDVSLLPLRRFLRDRGYHARSAGLGRITANVPELGAQLLARTLEMYRETGHKVTLIGWSMGGILSRGVARERPELVERVITFGTPVTGGPAHTAFGRGLTDADRAGSTTGSSSAARCRSACRSRRSGVGAMVWWRRLPASTSDPRRWSTWRCPAPTWAWASIRMCGASSPIDSARSPDNPVTALA